MSNVSYLRTPWLGWFPWDKVRGGWRVRQSDLVMFEWRAAQWAWRHRNQFDVIQICELPNFIHYFRERQRREQSGGAVPKLVLRMTGPYLHDPHQAVEQADAMIASGATYRFAMKRYHLPRHNVPNGVDLTNFRPKILGRKTPSDPVHLVYVARFQNFKNHDLLIRAFRIVHQQSPNTCLSLIGSGPLESRCRKQVTEYGLSQVVEFRGEVAFSEMPALYASADCAVISSTYESFCFAAIEAMAAGLPIVTTDAGWVTTLIGDTLPPIDEVLLLGQEPDDRYEQTVDAFRIRSAPGGLIAHRNDEGALAEAILRMIKNRELQESCAQWNRQRAEQEHGWEQSARTLHETYTDLLSGGVGPAGKITGLR